MFVCKRLCETKKKDSNFFVDVVLYVQVEQHRSKVIKI